MTRLLEIAIEAARQLEPAEQDELARTIMEIVGGANESVYVLSEEERAAVEEGLAQAERGEFASDDEVAALLSNRRL
jgi:predicted transcriptional regulator